VDTLGRAPGTGTKVGRVEKGWTPGLPLLRYSCSVLVLGVSTVYILGLRSWPRQEIFGQLRVYQPVPVWALQCQPDERKGFRC